MTHEVRGVDVEKYALLCQQTSPKRWFGNMEMTSNCDVTNSTPNTNDHHMTLNQTPPWKFSAYVTKNFFISELVKGHFYVWGVWPCFYWFFACPSAIWKLFVAYLFFFFFFNTEDFTLGCVAGKINKWYQIPMTKARSSCDTAKLKDLVASRFCKIRCCSFFNAIIWT